MVRLAVWNVNGIKSIAFDKDKSRMISEWTCRAKIDLLFLSEMQIRSDPDSQHTAHDHEGKEAISAALAPQGCFQHFDGRIRLSLAQKNYAGTAVLWRKDLHVKRIFTFLPSMDILKSHTAVEPSFECHEGEGRILLVELEKLLILHAYVPFNGSNPHSYQRRFEWDLKMIQWIKAARQAADQHNIKPLIYCGDLNLAPDDNDIVPASYLRAQNGDILDPRDRGKPGCSDHERERFRVLLEEGGLVDAYRSLHPARIPKPSTDEFCLEKGGLPYSWVGTRHRGLKGNMKVSGMRLDHFLVSKALVASGSVKTCTIGDQEFGSDDPRKAIGSDHWPVMIDLGL